MYAELTFGKLNIYMWPNCVLARCLVTRKINFLSVGDHGCKSCKAHHNIIGKVCVHVCAFFVRMYVHRPLPSNQRGVVIIKCIEFRGV